MSLPRTDKVMNNLSEMLRKLEQNPNVLGIIEYGSNTATDPIEAGDYDLMVILRHRNQAVTSLHFHVNGTPVDLGLITNEELRKLAPADSFYMSILLTGRILYDPTGTLHEQRIQPAQANAMEQRIQQSEHTIAFIRHGHRHLLDKVQGRFATMPTLCRLLLNTNIYWLLENYFRLRDLPFLGPKQSLAHLQTRDVRLHELIETFYSTEELAQKVALTYEITELVLAPVGGMWRTDEILAFGDQIYAIEERSRDLQQQGQACFQELFAPSALDES